MSTQSEYELEDKLINQLVVMGYSEKKVKNQIDMLCNLQQQLAKLNNTQFTSTEFIQILGHLGGGSVYNKAKKLRDRFALKRDNGEIFYVRFLINEDWSSNTFQVTHQITVQGTYKNRYDVTILINGLPLIQIELKRRGEELKKAFNQIKRYQHDSYDADYGLFQYIQLFIISDGVNTKYFANNNKPQPFKQTFYWTDKENTRLSEIHEFSKAFLSPTHITKMITDYTVLTEEHIIKVLRPYQVYAVEALIDMVKNHGKDNAYIWHATGSGKTLTSFKASQIIQSLPGVHKVVFVVDRKDLDYQTAREFNGFAKDSVDPTENTVNLVTQLKDDKVKLVLTTIQKLNKATNDHKKYFDDMKPLQHKKFIFIFDECHRSQFGIAHARITRFFTTCQIFGFTGTPIFEDNAIGRMGQQRTTKELFGERIHQYVVVDAIKDETVLPFSVEYIAPNLDDPQRLEKIVGYILKYHSQKTKAPAFTAMFCVDSINTLINYYSIFKQQQENKEKPLKIATIFSYAAYEGNPNKDGAILDEDPSPDTLNGYHRTNLSKFINDYNTTFSTNFNANTTQAYDDYYHDISKRVRQGEIDILLVVNMFLTGFDSPRLNTLYVDKDLKNHGLIQAFSRTNRPLDAQKSHGNIICFRDLKEATDSAIALFSDKDARDIVLIQPYNVYVEQFNTVAGELLTKTPSPANVDSLIGEKEKQEFVTKFRKLLQTKNILTSFTDFKESDLKISNQDFEDYKSKYLDIYDTVKRHPEDDNSTEINNIDFELELITRDDINVDYILKLLVRLHKLDPKSIEAEELRKKIMTTAGVYLRPQHELIEQFIDNKLPKLELNINMQDEFNTYKNACKLDAFNQLCKDENFVPEKFQKLLDAYEVTQQFPRDQAMIDILKEQPSILARENSINQIFPKIQDYINTYIK